MVTGNIESCDNVAYCVLYGKGQPEKFPKIDSRKIVIHLIHGGSIQFFALEENNVYFVGPFDDKRILKQNLLREFIVGL